MTDIDPGKVITDLVSSGAVKAIGTDLLTISRIKAVIAQFPERFAKRVLTPQEFQTRLQKESCSAYLAKRWAAKEAISKALGTGIAKGVSFQHIEIRSDANGRPLVTLTGEALRQADLLGASQALLSLTDEGDQVIAFSVLI